MTSLLARLRLATAGVDVSRTSTTRISPFSPAFPSTILRKWFRSANSDNASHASEVQSITRNDPYGDILHDHRSRERYPYGPDGITHRAPPPIQEVDVQKEGVEPLRIKKVDNRGEIVTSSEAKQVYLHEKLKNQSQILTALPLYHVGREAKFERVPYWQNISRWKDVPESLWLDYSWGVRSTLHLSCSVH